MRECTQRTPLLMQTRMESRTPSATDECDEIMRSCSSLARKSQELSEIDVSDASAADKAYVVMRRALVAWEIAMQKTSITQKDSKEADEKYKEANQAKKTAEAAYDALRTASPAASEADLAAAKIALDRAEQELKDAFSNMMARSKAFGDDLIAQRARQDEYYAADRAWRHASAPIVQFFNNAADRLVRCLVFSSSKSPQPPDEQQQRLIERTQKKKD